MNELSNLQVFVRVVEEGSFSAAARQLGVTPSSVSRQMSQMEADLGARLFHRTTRKQNLTETGEVYFEHARRVVAELEDARLAVNKLSDAPTGKLHVTVEPDFAVSFLVPILPSFLKRFPDVQIRFTFTSENVDLIDGGIDLAIRIGHLADSSMIARKIAVSRSVVCASPGYIARYGTPKHPSDLVQHCCLSFKTSAGKNHWCFIENQTSLDVPISGRMNANSLVFLRGMALADCGIVMVPKWLIGEELKSGQLVPLLSEFAQEPSSTPINAVFSNTRHQAPKVRAFIDFLVEHISEV